MDYKGLLLDVNRTRLQEHPLLAATVGDIRIDDHPLGLGPDLDTVDLAVVGRRHVIVTRTNTLGDNCVLALRVGDDTS